MVQLTLQQDGDVRIVRVKDAKLTYPVLSPFFAAVREIVEAGARRRVVAEPPAAAVRHLTPTVAMAGCSEMGRGPPTAHLTTMANDVESKYVRG